MDSERVRDERAGEEAADPDRLLPGEDPASPYLDDAEKWVEVYEELLHFKNLPDYVHGLAFSPDGSTLAAACHDGTVRLYQAARAR